MTGQPMNRGGGTIGAQVHRFGDAVAVYVAGGQTVYLTPAEARKLARALNGCARSVAGERFAAHTFGSQSFAFAGATYPETKES